MTERCHHETFKQLAGDRPDQRAAGQPRLRNGVERGRNADPAPARRDAHDTPGVDGRAGPHRDAQPTAGPSATARPTLGPVDQAPVDLAAGLLAGQTLPEVSTRYAIDVSVAFTNRGTATLEGVLASALHQPGHRAHHGSGAHALAQP